MFACKMHVYSYFEKVYLCIYCFAYLCILLHIYAFFFGIFEHNFGSKANQFNEYSNCDVRSTRAQLLSLAVSSSLSLLQ